MEIHVDIYETESDHWQFVFIEMMKYLMGGDFGNLHLDISSRGTSLPGEQQQTPNSC
jgi:hypothetical protein